MSKITPYVNDYPKKTKQPPCDGWSDAIILPLELQELPQELLLQPPHHRPQLALLLEPLQELPQALSLEPPLEPRHHQNN
jgi:hypothetical protein